MRSKLTAAILFIASIGYGQTILTVTNNYLLPSHAALSGPVGSFRLNAEITDGVSPVDLTGSTNRLYVYDAGDYAFWPFTNAVLVGTFGGESTEGKVRWVIPSLSARTYILDGWSIQADTSLNFRIASHTLTVTQSVAVSSSLTMTNIIDLGNLTVQWEIQGDGDLAPNGTDRNISPRTDMGASLGRTNERYASADISTVRVSKIFADEADIGSAVGFLDTSKVALTGETNSVILTNAFVAVSDPTNELQVVNKRYADALSGGETGLVTIASWHPTGDLNTITFPITPVGNTLMISYSLFLKPYNGNVDALYMGFNGRTENKASRVWSGYQTGSGVLNTTEFMTNRILIGYISATTNFSATGTIIVNNYTNATHAKGGNFLAKAFYDGTSPTATDPTIDGYTIVNGSFIFNGVGPITSVTFYSSGTTNFNAGYLDIKAITL